MISSELQALREKVAWHNSWTRRCLIALTIFVAECVLLQMKGDDKFLLHSIVPTLAYIVSTWSLPFVKNPWLLNFRKKQSGKESHDES